ncbi:phage holin family protein [Bradyrhizobium sp. Arg237L]|uniref:phage holin family protein n=1 Tax=Bradyrhizobium sp. Arg237L TaxID=3003352 RepID=UPI00249DB2E7|nr:phage holin family protein [Bradyrhizobium sp. Arg237L]MDI4232634.1 phage holin family protein [Bradyrhizobium sp. Arg237L]
MLQRLVSDVREQAGNAMRLTSLAVVIAATALIALGFLCAAFFVWVHQTNGPIWACLACAALFVVVAVIAAALYVARKRQMRLRAEEMARAARQSLLTNPAVLATGLQLVRAIGVKRLVPILAIGGLALGLMASRSAASDPPPPDK